MKSLSAAPAEPSEAIDTVADAVVVRAYVRPTPPPPPPVRKPPVVAPPVRLRPVVTEPLDLPEDEEELPTSRGKVAFDPQLWQWREEGGFVHIKTGELREESEFIDPDARNKDDDSGEWDDPQTGGDDW